MTARGAGGGPVLDVRVPGDKSITQRALILGAMADGESRIGRMPRGADPLATAAALTALGIDIHGLDGPSDASVTIRGRGLRGWRQPPVPLDLRNSGTGARLVAGALAAQPLSATLTGDASLSRRPMGRIAGPLGRMGAQVDHLGGAGVLPMRVTGGALRDIRHDGAVASAQVKSAILLAAVGGGVAVEVAEPRRSRDHTERMLRAMGVEVDEGWRGGSWVVRLPRPPARLLPLDMEVPGDYSSAAFLLAWAALAGSGAGRPAGSAVRSARAGGGRRPLRELVIRGVGTNPTRTGFGAVLGRMGVAVRVEAAEETGGEPVGDLRCTLPAHRLRAVEVGADEIPGMIDEVPALAVLAARAQGVTRITGAEELRVKESDRLAALTANLGRIGVEVRERPDGMEIEGTDRPLSGAIECFGDHRIAMAFGVLGATPGCTLEVDDPGVADVSFPGFWELLDRVAGRAGGAARASSRCKIIAIDGSSGAGKSTTAAAVAERLGLRHLDSGALYRAAAYALLQSPRRPKAWDRITLDELAALRLDVCWRGTRMEVVLDGDIVPDDSLRGEEVTAAASRVAAIPIVRDHLLGIQRDAAVGPGLVAEGRDMATVVFPGAHLKVFLDADIRTRARRRVLQRGGGADVQQVDAEARRIESRDRRDRERAAAPLVQSRDAFVVDTTHLDPEEQVEAVVQRALPFLTSI